MASSVGGQGKPGLLAVSRKKNPRIPQNKSLTDQKLVWTRLLDIGRVLFLRDYGPSDKHVKIELHWLLSSHLDLALAQ